MGTLGLLGLLTWAGNGHPAWSEGGWGWAQGFTGWVAQIFGGLGRVFDGLVLGQRLGFWFVALVVLYLYWRATRALLAYKPGPVDVQELIDATPPGTLDVPTGDLTAELRQQLSDCSIYAPTTLPAEAPPMSFLELVGDVELDPKKLGTAIPRLLSRLRPKLAYRVGGVLRTREQRPDRFGVTVTVTAFVFGGSSSTTLWGREWDEVIRKTGCWVISALLPVTRAGRQPPWRQWWGRELNPELYEAYQSANEFSRAGRYHEALSRYFDAIALDPKNPYLRGELAEVQEKMGLHIDALETCQRALTLDGQTSRQYNRRLWLKPRQPDWQRLRYLRHPRLYRDVLGLRYRNAIILGMSEETTQQWFQRKGSQDDTTRHRLVPLLADRYQQAASTLAPPGYEEVWLARVLEQSLYGGRSESAAGAKNFVRLVFQRAATQEMNCLAADDRWARLAGLYWLARLRSCFRLISPFSHVQSVRGPRQAVTRGAFRINREVWAPLRLAWAVEKMQPPGPVCGPHPRYVWRTGPPVTTHVTPCELDTRIDRARSRLVFVRRYLPRCRRGDWLTRYTSACVHAVAMKINRGSEAQMKEHTQRAVEELECAILIPRGDSATVERTWMVHEDPDLALLRKAALFESFVLTAYPGQELPEHPPPNSWSEAQMRDYDYRLLEEAAKVMEQVWILRGEEPSFDIRDATEWLRAESDIWNGMRKVTDSRRLGHWEYRVELIRSVRAGSQPTLPATLGFPPSMLPDGTVRSDRQKITRRLRRLQSDLRRDVIGENAHYTNIQEGQDVFSRATADGVTWLDPSTVHSLCTAYSAVWQTLAEWLEQDRAESHFVDALDRVPKPSATGLPREGVPRYGS
ncbi:tetratricopeptide repeat protein [Streptomyces sp. NPDC058620]|uniref:tetratricopeptide repeat protein n=1 Tax=Streptomyces sp. NPDC058620 TaxID=3346560 RepID=UPI00366285A0